MWHKHQPHYPCTCANPKTCASRFDCKKTHPDIVPMKDTRDTSLKTAFKIMKRHLFGNNRHF